MKDDTYSITEVSRATGASEPTLRRWVPLFADSLSTGANPPYGAQRRFTGRDVQILAAAVKMRADGLSVATVAERLQNVTEADLPDLERLTTLTTVSPAVTDTAKTRSLVVKGGANDVKAIAAATEAIAKNLGALSETNAELAELRASIDRLSQRLEAVEHAVSSLPWYARPRKP